MNKRKLHHYFKFVKRIRASYFLYIAIFFLALGVIGLRENNLQMIELREQVHIADEQNTNIEKPLRELREHVHSHMNTDLSSGNVSIKPPVQLKHRYERLLEQEEKRANQVNRAVKKEGEQECARRFPASGLNAARVNCVAEYSRVNAIKPKQIPNELYKFDFVSPVWSADFAGLSLLASLLLFAGFIIRLLVGWFYKREL
jgi:preprotein translocase subunit SecF